MASVVRHLSVMYLLLNHSAKFSQPCYITSPRGKCVRGQDYFSLCSFVRPSFVHLSVRLSLPNKLLGAGVCCVCVEGGGRDSTKLASSLPLMVRVCTSNIIFPCVSPSSRPASGHLSVTLSPPKPLGRIYSNFLHDLSLW